MHIVVALDEQAELRKLRSRFDSKGAAAAAADDSGSSSFSSHEKNNHAADVAIEMLLPRRSAYVLTAEARYQWAHVVPKEPSFRGREIQKTRRLSILLRDHAAAEAGMPASPATPDGGTADSPPTSMGVG